MHYFPYGGGSPLSCPAASGSSDGVTTIFDNVTCSDCRARIAAHVGMPDGYAVRRDPSLDVTSFERVSPLIADDHAALVAYLLSAVRRKDWHAVSDAANDLRVLEARGAR